jgi:hypothetical protein
LNAARRRQKFAAESRLSKPVRIFTGKALIRRSLKNQEADRYNLFGQYQLGGFQWAVLTSSIKNCRAGSRTFFSHLWYADLADTKQKQPL